MLDRFIAQGRHDALVRFKLALTEPPGMLGGMLGKAKAFGSSQLQAGKDLFSNLRGGLGGQMNPGLIEGAVPPQSMDMARASHRQQALGNLKTLAPSLLAGGGLYMMHRHNRQQEQQPQQQQMQQQQMPLQGYPMM